MKIIFKNFIYILKRFKTSSVLNILGLSAAFAVFIALLTQVYFDLSFNRSFKDVDDVYLMSYYSIFNDTHGAWFNTQTADIVASKTPLIEAYTTLHLGTTYKYYIEGSEPNNVMEEPVIQIRGDFEAVFHPTVLEGNWAEALSAGNALAISESVAKKLFGNESALNKTLIGYYNQNSFTIKAIIKDFPKNSTFSNGIFRYLPLHDETETAYNIFFRIKSQNRTQITDFLNSEEYLSKEVVQQMLEEPSHKVKHSLIPFTDIHLDYPVMGNGDWNITIALITIALLTLAIAYINFFNFSLAMIPSRVKALTIQRVLGINKRIQRFLIATESAFFSLIAFSLGILLINFISGSAIAELFSADLTAINQPQVLVLGAVTALTLGLIVGAYPAKYATQFDVVESLKGTSSANTKSCIKLRSILITFQFMAAITLISITISIKLQYDYIVNYSWGIEKENIIYINAENTGINYDLFSEELLKDARIIEHTRSQYVPGYVYMGWGRPWKGKQVNLQSWPVAHNYLKFFGATLIAGEDFPQSYNPDKKKMIFNEEFLRKYEFNIEEILGAEMFVFIDNAEIIGVIKDINFESLKIPIRPMAFITLEDRRNNILYFKLTGNDTRGAIQMIEDTWKKHTKETLDLKFLDETLEGLYHTEGNLGKLVGLFSVITILIAMMGVYGLITFNIKYRKKEIAIRKINGASEMQIVSLINKGMLIQLVIGFIIATPLSYWIIDKWLSNFAYRIQIQWWVFILSGLSIFVIALIAVSWQSYNAATTNPVNSLKSE